MLSIDLSAIAVFFIVWMLLVVLSKVFFNPLRRVMEERKRRIEANREAAEKAFEMSERQSLQVEEKLKEARAAAQATVEEFKRQGLEEKERILGEMSTDCRRRIEEAKKRLAWQVESLKRELESQSKQLAESIEKRILN
ncbi:MAG: ATP synthase F0 subunit B [Candidatus Aminicenantales bacterium]